MLPTHDIAVLAVPRLAAVSIEGTSATASTDGSSLRLGKSSWIWQAGENAMAAPVDTRHFKREFQADPATLESAHLKVTADNSYVLTVNGRPVLKDDDWKTQETASIKEHLKAGINTISVAVTNLVESPQVESAVGLIGANGWFTTNTIQHASPRATRC
jgi:hypothetical protein